MDFTVEEVAKACKVKTPTIYKWKNQMGLDTFMSRGVNGFLLVTISANDLARWIDTRPIYPRTNHLHLHKREPWDVIEERLKEIVYRRWGYWPESVLDSEEDEKQMNIETLRMDLERLMEPEPTRYPFTFSRQKMLAHGLSEEIANRLDGITFYHPNCLPMREAA